MNALNLKSFLCALLWTHWLLAPLGELKAQGIGNLLMPTTPTQAQNPGVNLFANPDQLIKDYGNTQRTGTNTGGNQQTQTTPVFTNQGPVSREECEKTTHRQWSEVYNRCVNMVSAQQVRDVFAFCESKAFDPNRGGTREEKVKIEREGIQCLKDIAASVSFSDNNLIVNQKDGELTKEGYLTDGYKGSDFDGGGALGAVNEVTAFATTDIAKYASMGISGLSTLFVALNFFVKEKFLQCNLVAYKLIGAGSVLSLLGEAGSLAFFKIRSKMLLDDFEGMENKGEGGFFEMQKEAFTYFSQVQKARGIAEIARAATYLLSTLLHGGALIAAAVEGQHGALACFAGHKMKNKAFQGKTVEDVMKQMSLLEKLPKVPMVWAGILTTMTGIMGGVAVKSAVVALERAELLIDAREKFISTLAQSGFRCTTREDMNDPKCYCYTEKGKKNPARVNSKICAAFYKSRALQGPKAFEAKNYSLVAKEYNPEGCVNRKGAFDRQCDCKKLKDLRGNNNCMTMRNFPSSSFSLASGPVTKGMVDTVERMGSGGLNPGLLRMGRAQNLAANLLGDVNRISMALEKDPWKGKVLKLSPKEFDSLTKNLAKVLPTSKSALAHNQLLASSGALATETPLNDSLNSLKDKGGDELNRELMPTQSQLTYGGGATQGAVNKDNKKTGLEHLLNYDEGGGSASKVEKFKIPEDLHIKNHDIHQKSKRSLWEIISHRYQASALKKLFSP